MCPSNGTCRLGIWGILTGPLLFYLFWQVVQIFIVEIMFGNYIRNDKSLMTSMRWLMHDRRNFMHQLTKKLMRRFGVLAPAEELDPESIKSKCIFWFIQLLYTILTFVPPAIVFHNYYAHVCYLLYLSFQCAWNGASYYINVFTVRYQMKFAGSEGKVSAMDLQLAMAADPDLLPKSPTTQSDRERRE